MTKEKKKQELEKKLKEEILKEFEDGMMWRQELANNIAKKLISKFQIKEKK